jgi:hypothetical protein
MWILILVILGVGGVVLTALQREEAQKETAKREEQLDKLLQLASGPARSPESADRLTHVLEQLEARLAATPHPGLKLRVSTLSAEILAFLADRERHGPPIMPRKDHWTEDTAIIIGYFEETMRLYSQRFAARVIAARNELAEQGLRDEELDRFYDHPTNPIGVRMVGERIGALAERLP